jgi:hypothetical protein
MTAPQPVRGSFRDPAARVYADGDRILRGTDAVTLANFEALARTRFFGDAVREGRIVGSRSLGKGDPGAAAVLDQGWAGVLEHDRVPLLSYPYEWTFSMLKDAALLHLDLLEKSLDEGWIIKDSTPYNIQFVGATPTFIDVPSFVPRPPGDYWRGYRQFCMCFLYPLMLTAYRGIPFQVFLRSSLDGIAPVDAARYFTGLGIFRKGVLSHVRFPAALEGRAAAHHTGKAEDAQHKARRHSDAMVKGLVQSMQRIVRALPAASGASAWSDYATTHSYDDASFQEKKAFVAKAASREPLGTVWDLGSNTGIFSELLAQSAAHVVSVDSDHECVERLYLRLRERGDRRILPLTMNLANPSPGQGWAGVERLPFDQRNRPDLILGLALIHHICLSSNVPIPDFLDWLAGTGAKLIIEFVDRDDIMVKEMLSRKSETHEDYNLQNFETELRRRYDVVHSVSLKAGERQIYYCSPLRPGSSKGAAMTSTS